MTLYDTLGVPTDASKQTIEKAYRKKAMTKHPDHGGDVEEFKTLTLAYTILKDSDKRDHYDRTGRTDKEHSPEDRLLRALIVEAFVTSDTPITWMLEKLTSQRNQLDTKREHLKLANKNITKRLKKFTGKHENQLIQETLDAALLDINDKTTEVTKELDSLTNLIKMFKEVQEPQTNSKSSSMSDIERLMKQMSGGNTWGVNWNP